MSSPATVTALEASYLKANVNLLPSGLGTSWTVSKRAADILGAIFFLIVLSPFLIAIAAMTLRTGGPVFFKQQRIGRNGRSFGCYKFRTMVPQAEQLLLELLERNPKLREEWESDHKLRSDPRVTSVGRFLRKTSLDELPQLFNVLRGEMSLIGPRPIVDVELQRYGRASRWYFAVRPGMTGLWQVSGRNDCDYRRRIALDIYYVRAQSFGLDLSILLRTARVVLFGRGAY